MYNILVLDTGGTYAPYTPDHTQWKIDTDSFTYPSFSLNAKLAEMQLPNAFIDFDAENRSNSLFSGGNFIYGVPQGGLVAPQDVMDGMIYIPVEEATKSRYE